MVVREPTPNLEVVVEVMPWWRYPVVQEVVPLELLLGVVVVVVVVLGLVGTVVVDVRAVL